MHARLDLQAIALLLFAVVLAIAVGGSAPRYGYGGGGYYGRGYYGRGYVPYYGGGRGYGRGLRGYGFRR